MEKKNRAFLKPIAILAASVLGGGAGAVTASENVNVENGLNKTPKTTFILGAAKSASNPDDKALLAWHSSHSSHGSHGSHTSHGSGS